MKHSQKNSYFAHLLKNNTCADSGNIHKYLWISTSWQQV